MRILLDECVPRKLKSHFPEHECDTAPRLGWAGKSNGELLRLAEEAGFNVLLTVDTGVRRQQNLVGRKIGFIVIHAESNKLKALLPHVPACLAALRLIRPGGVRIIGAPL